jgi:hypothetical protein
MNDLTPGGTKGQTFLLHSGAKLVGNGGTTFSVDNTATILGKSQISPTATETIRIPVQFFIPLPNKSLLAVEGPIWASGVTDYTAVGFENPLGDVFTDWTTIPLRLGKTTKQVDLSVYDPAGADHMDVFVFNSAGEEIASTVSSDPSAWIPNGAGYAPTTKDSPETE